MKLEFFSTVDGVADAHPILPAREVIPKWVNNARAEYLTDKQRVNVFRCPGIMDLFGAGYVVTAWHDIKVESLGELKVYAPNSALEELLGYPPLSTHSDVAKHIPHRPWSHKSILKINTPWHVKSKVKFMMIPLPYSENFDIESTIGIWDPAVSSEINVQLYVNRIGTFDIKAGTPLCQLVPITEKTYELVVRDMNTADEKWIKRRQYLNNMNFVLNRNIIKNAYRAFIK